MTLHFLKTILNIFLNSECNYSCDGFVKVLAEMEPGAFGLSGDREVAMLGGRDIRELYFKLVKQFFMAREAHGADKRHSSERGLVEKIMGTGLADLFHAWNEAS